ncbi:carboxypeptidase B-like [Gigantopelta aegis]|uniref:carboxypeptidase B-like n=1 Tax=Gigantopelta aegis TaxID=1735272 RepID=UPI001B8891C6|nr:carboxypeptidase B-like [Gigantopelta aegis]XP_041377101.1 carboxypeptidase B-like [Gigantopelta aegis]
MPSWITLLICAVGVWRSLASEHDSAKRYDGYKVYRVFPGNTKDIRDVFLDMDLDVWNDAGHDGDHVIVMVSPGQQTTFKDFLKKHGISSEVFIDDVQKYIEQEEGELKYRRRRQVSSLLGQISNSYLPYNEIINMVTKIKNDASGHANVDLINYGTSSEGRTLYVAKISDGNTCKPAILIDGGFHAREWISPATVLRFIYELVMNSANTDLVGKFDWYIIPVMNPDGYEYTRTKDRMWRKTRNVNTGNTCRGTDPNRNFDYHWDPYAGASTNPCSEVYAGPNPLSVPETVALSNLMNQHKDKLKLYLTVHSFGQIFLYPYGYSSTSRAPDHRELTRLANVAISAMKSYSYSVGSSGPDFSVAAGGSDDYAKGKMNIKYSYTMELPERSFILSTSKISTVAADAWKGIKAMALDLSALPYSKGLPCTPAPSATAKPTPSPATPKATTARPTTPKAATKHPCCTYMAMYSSYGYYYTLLKRCCETYG